MNIVFMAVMMGLAIIFFHGQGHHNPSPETEHHASNPNEAKKPSPETAKPSHHAEEPSSEKAPVPAAPARVDPAPKVE